MQNLDDDSSYVSLALALITLSPILLMVWYIDFLYLNGIHGVIGFLRCIGRADTRVSHHYHVGRPVRSGIPELDY